MHQERKHTEKNAPAKGEDVPDHIGWSPVNGDKGSAYGGTTVCRHGWYETTHVCESWQSDGGATEQLRSEVQVILQSNVAPVLNMDTPEKNVIASNAAKARLRPRIACSLRARSGRESNGEVQPHGT